MIRATILGLTGAIAVSSGVAADSNLCKAIQLHPSNSFFGLYYLPEGQSAWKVAEDWQLGSQLPIRRGNVRFALVINPLPQRSGVINVRIRTEAKGSQPDAALVNIQRDAVDEPCGPFGWRHQSGAFSSAVPTKTYETYHNPSTPITDPRLDHFHFSYKPDQGDCVKTNAGNRAPSFRFTSVPNALPIGMDSGELARAVIPPELDTPMASLAHGFATAFTEVIPGARAYESSPAQPPLPTHYTKLVSLLRKYDAKKTGQDCVGFPITANPNETTTYISITDFDAGSYLTSSYYPDHWQIIWQAP